MRSYGLMIIRIRLVRLLSHSLVILYHNLYQMSNYFLRKWVTRKGIEPHPTDGDLLGTPFLATLSLMMRSLSLTPCHAV